MISENLLGVMDTWYYLPIIMGGFVLLIITLNQFLYKPVLKIIDERKKFMHDMKEKAHGLLEKSQELTHTYNTELSHEKKESFQKLDLKKKEIQKKSQEEIQNAKREADSFVSKELERVNKSYEGAKQELIKDVELLSSEIIEKISELNTHKAHSHSKLSASTEGELLI